MSRTVCSCFHVTKKDIAGAVRDGAASFREVKAATKVSKACGKCRKRAKKLTKKLLKKTAGKSA